MNTRKLSSALLAAFIAQAAASVPGTVQADATPQVSALIDPFIQRTFEQTDLVPGMSVVVVSGSEVVYLRGFGLRNTLTGDPMTPDTPVYIASSTKSFTALAAAILEQRGVWDLDDPLADYLPGLRLPSQLTPEEVTLRSLLTHTSRLSNGPVNFRTAFTGEWTRGILLDLLAESGVGEPGFAYDNLGYIMTSLAMDELAPDGWQGILQREILGPLGMTHTATSRTAYPDAELAQPHGIGPDGHFEPRPYIKSDSNMHAAGGMISSAADLGRWLEANLNAGVVDGCQAVPAEALRAAHQLQVTTDSSFYEFTRTGYGLGWYHGLYGGELLLHHFGAYPGFRAHVSFMPEHHLGVAVLTNATDQGYYLPEIVAAYIYDRLLGRPGLDAKYAAILEQQLREAREARASLAEARAKLAARPPSFTLPLASYAGIFENPVLGTLQVYAEGGQLTVQMGALRSGIFPGEAPNVGRVELIPDDGQSLAFIGAEGAFEAVEYQGRRFERSAP